MSWIKLDDHFDEHPKVVAVGPLGMAMWVASIAHCNRNLTNGFIPWAKARTLLPLTFLTKDEHGQKIWEANLSSGFKGFEGPEVTEMVIARLVAENLWEEVEDGYVVHDYLNHQRSKEQIKNERKSGAVRQRRFKASKGNVQGNGVTNALVMRESHDQEVEVEVDSSAFFDSSASELKLSALANVPQRRKKKADAAVLELRKEWAEAFDQHFWPSYPRKVEKEDARAAWAKLPAKALGNGHFPSLDELEKLLGSVLSGVRWWSAEWERLESIVPYPATWLNKRSYTDATQE